MPLSYNKVCNLEDFSNIDLKAIFQDVFSFETRRCGPSFPEGREYRKYWEIAMAVRALRDLGAIHQNAELLGVGAGNEPTSFYLTNKVRRVFATDLYLEPGVWKDFAEASMLTDPGIHWPSEWKPRRLVVQHMNGLDLQYEDGSFDGIFSSSSIEHFGSLENIKRGLDEMFRLLKPGGVLSLSTEFRIEGPSPGLPGCFMFDRSELEEHFIGGRDWALASSLDTEVSSSTLREEIVQEDAARDVRDHFERHGRLVYHELEFSQWPQIAMRWGNHLFTSVHLALIKGG